MLTFKVRRRVFWGLASGFMAAAMLGCQPRPTTPPAGSTWHAEPKSQPARRMKKSNETRKSPEPSNPARWRRKLRAKYC